MDYHRPISQSYKAPAATEIETGARLGSLLQTPGDVVMTQQFHQFPEQSSRLNTFVIGAFMSAMIVLAGLLSFAPYSLI